jgi:hypothetical protein
VNIIVEMKTDDGQPLGVLTASPKDFKTGSRGFYVQGKLEVAGKRYQVQVQLIEIGSKEAAQAA